MIRGLVFGVFSPYINCVWISIIAPLMPGLFDSSDSFKLRFDLIRDNQFIMKRIINLLNMLIITQIFILD